MKSAIRRWPDEMLAAGMAAIVFLVYLRVTSFDFVNWDDTHFVMSSLVSKWTEHSWLERLQTRTVGYPAPLPIATWAALHDVFGYRAGPFHAINVVLHGANTLLVFAWARRVGADRFVAGVATALWSFHPLGVESVAWVTGLKEVMLGTGILVAAHAGLDFSERKRRAYALALVGLACALGAKPTGAVAGPVILLHLWVGSRSKGGSSSRAGWVVGGLASLVGLLHASLALRSHAEFGGHVTGSLTQFIASLSLQVQHFFVPIGLGPHYFFTGVSFEDWLFAVSGAVCVVALLAWGLARDQPLIASGAGLALLAYLPSANLVAPLARFTADAYAYVPVMGLSLLTATGIARLGSARRAVAALVVLGLLVVNLGQQKHWADGIALWTRALAVSDSTQARNFEWMKLGQAHATYGGWSAAIESFEQANTSVFGRAFGFPKSWPRAYHELGQEETAERLYVEGIRRLPRNATQRRAWRALVEAYASFLHDTGRPLSTAIPDEASRLLSRHQDSAAP